MLAFVSDYVIVWTVAIASCCPPQNAVVLYARRACNHKHIPWQLSAQGRDKDQPVVFYYKIFVSEWNVVRLKFSLQVWLLSLSHSLFSHFCCSTILMCADFPPLFCRKICDVTSRFILSQQRLHKLLPSVTWRDEALAGICGRFRGTVGKISAALGYVTFRSTLIIIICVDVDFPLLPPFLLPSHNQIFVGRWRTTIMLPPSHVLLPGTK
jgi:hypothetical protein